MEKTAAATDDLETDYRHRTRGLAFGHFDTPADYCLYSREIYEDTSELKVLSSCFMVIGSKRRPEGGGEGEQLLCDAEATVCE